MIELKDRIKTVRTQKGMNQNEFADFLGTSLSNLKSYETGRRNPSNGIISLIVAKCGVRERWLRDGIGDPYVPKTKEEEIAEFLGTLTHDQEDTFKRNFVHMLSKLDPNDWATIEKMVDLMVDENNKKAGD